MPKPHNARLRRLEEERKVRVDTRLGDKRGDQLTRAYDGFPWTVAPSQKERDKGEG